MRSTMSRWLLTAALLAVTALPALAAQGYLGVTTQATDEDLRRGLDLTRDGLLVNQVEEDSPADRAGIRKGDVILSFNSRSVSEPSELRQLVRQTEAGRTVSISIWRNGERKSLDVKLGDVSDAGDMIDVPTPPRTPRTPRAPRAPEAPRAPRHIEIHGDDDGGQHGDMKRRVIINGKEIPEDEIDETLKDMKIKVFSDDDGKSFGWEPKSLKGLEKLRDMQLSPGWGGGNGELFFAPTPGGRGRLGVRVEKLNDEMRDALGAKDGHGVLVLEVMGDTPAQRAGMRAGDIILKVGGDDVESPESLVKSLRSHDGKVTVHVLRKGLTKSLEAELESNSLEDRVRTRVAPRVRIQRGNPEPGQGGRVYRSYTNDDDDASELREELDELKKELRELRELLREKR